MKTGTVEPAMATKFRIIELEGEVGSERFSSPTGH